MVEDLCDFAFDLLGESKWKGASALVDAASVLAAAVEIVEAGATTQEMKRRRSRRDIVPITFDEGISEYR